MKSSFKLFSIFGIGLELHITFVLLFILLAISLFLFAPEIFLGGILLFLMLFISVFVHELSHSLVAMRFGVKVKKIILLLTLSDEKYSRGELPKSNPAMRLPSSSPPSKQICRPSDFAFCLASAASRHGRTSAAPLTSAVIIVVVARRTSIMRHKVLFPKRSVRKLGDSNTSSFTLSFSKITTHIFQVNQSKSITQHYISV